MFLGLQSAGQAECTQGGQSERASSVSFRSQKKIPQTARLHYGPGERKRMDQSLTQYGERVRDLGP